MDRFRSTNNSIHFTKNKTFQKHNTKLELGKHVSDTSVSIVSSMFFKLKRFVVFLKCHISILLLRNFGVSQETNKKLVPFLCSHFCCAR